LPGPARQTPTRSNAVTKKLIHRLGWPRNHNFFAALIEQPPDQPDVRNHRQFRTVERDHSKPRRLGASQADPCVKGR
jgi:hypothetical protein